MTRKIPIFYSALLLTGVNLLLRRVSTAFQVHISGRLGAEGVGLLQLVMSVGGLAMTAGIRKVMSDDPSVFDPRLYLGPARDMLKELFARKNREVLGSAGHAND